MGVMDIVLPAILLPWRVRPYTALLLILLAAAAVAALRPPPPSSSSTSSPPLSAPTPNAPSATLRLRRVPGPGIRLAWEGGARGILYRSAHDLRIGPLDVVHYPVARIPVTGHEAADDAPPDGVTLYYQLQCDGKFSNVVALATPPRPLPHLEHPVLRVDKRHYVLEVADADRKTLKRYPIALGQNPFRRKLHQDNASTPEGVYRITAVQSEATYYRAYDVSYPNAADRLRYAFARSHGLLPAGPPGIGGEIQIHGQGVLRNWTFGCMAMRNEDVDELMAEPAIGVDTPLLIFGDELDRADVEALWDPTRAGEGWRPLQQTLQARGLMKGATDGKLSEATMQALGAFQLAHRLPLTCLPDRRTRALLERAGAM